MLHVEINKGVVFFIINKKKVERLPFVRNTYIEQVYNE